jgi:hypothetical protein
MRLPATILQQIVGHPVDHFAGSGHKRALGRLTVDRSAFLFGIRDELLDDSFDVTIRDVSAETIGIETPRAMMPSSSMIVQIPMSGSDSLAIRCKVMRCTRMREGGFILAAEFTEIIDPQILVSREKPIS